jgi:hypothetical protein
VADYGLFIGWGSPRAGKEAAAGALFAESIEYWKKLEADGRIDSMELVVLGPHGGDLAGYALLRGEPERLAPLRMTPEFRRLVMRAGTCLDHVGIVDAQLDGQVMTSMQEWQEAVADLV